MTIRLLITLTLVVSLGLTVYAVDKDATPISTATLDVDNTVFIDANQILMFVTNYGTFGRDLGPVFGYGHGTWWPYTGDTSLISHNIDGAGDKTPLYQAGLWLAGIDSVTNDTLSAICLYSTEYVPGPMEGGTFMPDDPAFKVYKLYMDSLESNPNDDYSNWPTDQGAPLDAFGRPYMLGRQMLWTVFNDADPAAHTVSRGGGTAPLGIEVQRTIWAGDELGEDTICYGKVLDVSRFNNSGMDIEVTAWVENRESITGDEYRVTFEDTVITQEIVDPEKGTVVDTVCYFAWHLDNVSTGQRILSWQYPDSASVEVEGIKVRVLVQPYGFESFEVTANASGPLEPPRPGALASAGFPTPGDADPGEDQQVGDGKWLFHVADVGDNYPDFASFYNRLEGLFEVMGYFDYEIRFTGSNDNPGIGGGYAASIDSPYDPIWVPFEIWQIGVGTPDDPSDDVRLVPVILDLAGDDLFALESWGSIENGTCAATCEHSTSDGDDDPYTDRLYWAIPIDDSPGESGYQSVEADILAGTFNIDLLWERQVFYRIVLVNWDAGEEPPFAQTCPEQGTVFRVLTNKPTAPPDTFSFTVTQPPFYVSTLEGSALYLKYKFFNLSDRTLKGMYIGFWSEPDLGYTGDNFVGCDTLNDIWFCYNADNDDGVYGVAPPAIGFKLLYGPVVPATGETAFFDGAVLADHRNLPMTSFLKFFHADEPYDVEDTYYVLRGYRAYYENAYIGFEHPGDPVTGTGDLDITPADRRMLAASGPFDMHPGDSQFVLIKMAVGKGTDNLNSITELRAILNEPFDPLTDVPGSETPGLPGEFAVKQNYPNPFNPSTVIEYTLPRRAPVTVDVFNILGQRVRRLVDEVKPAGEHSVVWDGTNGNGEAVSTGLYFYRVRAGDSIDSRKMLLLK